MARIVPLMGQPGCAVQTCDRVAVSRGWCDTHYRRWRRTGTTDDPVRGPTVCTVDGCEAKVDARGLCHGHHQRLLRTGSVQAHIPLGRRRQPEVCAVDGCDGATKGLGLCPRHWWRRWRHGNVDAGGLLKIVTSDRMDVESEQRCCEPDCAAAVVARDRCGGCYKVALRRGQVGADPDVRVVTGEGHLSHGYWKVPVPEPDRHLVGGHAAVGEHRLVIARLLGRPLELDEQVHHINGDRLDNRPENLELWSTSHPGGQRVQDKIEWAVSILERYCPERFQNIKTAIDSSE